MSVRRLLAAAVVFAVVPAGAQVGYRLSLTQYGGFADNVLSTADVDPTVHPVSSGFYVVEPDLKLTIGLGPRAGLAVRYASELAVYFDDEGGLQQWHYGMVRGLVRLGPVKLLATAFGAGYSFEAFSEDSFGQVGGSLEARLGLRRLTAAASFSAVGRYFTESESTSLGDKREDLDLGAGVWLAYRFPINLTASLGYQHLSRSSNEEYVDRPYHSPWARLHYELGRVSADASYSMTIRTASGDAPDIYHGVSATVGIRLLRWLSLRGRYRLAMDLTDDEDLAFVAHEGTLGISVSLTPRRRPPSPPPLTPRRTPDGMRFRIHRPEAARVAVVGDFNGWDATKGRMGGPDRDGWFEIVVPIPPGRYEYQFVVDGEFVSPEGGVRLIRSAFGPPNGLLEVR